MPVAWAEEHMLGVAGFFGCFYQVPWWWGACSVSSLMHYPHWLLLSGVQAAGRVFVFAGIVGHCY